MLIITPKPTTEKEKDLISSYVKSFLPVREMMKHTISDPCELERETMAWDIEEMKSPLFWKYYPSWKPFDHINYQMHFLQ